MKNSSEEESRVSIAKDLNFSYSSLGVKYFDKNKKFAVSHNIPTADTFLEFFLTKNEESNIFLSNKVFYQ